MVQQGHLRSRLLEFILLGELVLVVQPGICNKMHVFSLSSLPIHWMSRRIPYLLVPCSVYADKTRHSPLRKKGRWMPEPCIQSFVCIAVALNNQLLPPTNPWWASRADKESVTWAYQENEAGPSPTECSPSIYATSPMNESKREGLPRKK